MTSIKLKCFLALLILEFWLSGLFVLGVIFLDVEDLDTLTLFTFTAYAVGSFLAGVLSDLMGRRPLFIAASLLLCCSAIATYLNLWAGLIMANLCIGPINNLTFIFLNQNPELSHETNYVKVLLGWVASEIALGLYYLLVGDTQLFLSLLIPFTGVYAVCAVYLTKQTPIFLQSQAKANKKSCFQIFVPNQIKYLLGGSMLMFMMQMFYYRTQFTLDRFGISLQVNTIIVGCTEGLANILLSPYIRKCQRKKSLIVLLVALMFLLLLLILVKSAELQTVIEGTMRFCDSCIMLVLGFYLPELFSVEQRGKGTNYVMSMGVFGSALSGILFQKLPFGYLEIFLFAALIGLLFLPETLMEGRTAQEHREISYTILQDPQ